MASSNCYTYPRVYIPSKEELFSIVRGGIISMSKQKKKNKGKLG